MEDLLGPAQAASDAQYLELEREARRRAEGNDVQVAALRRIANDVDPVKALMAQVVLGWVGERGEDYQKALDYLDGLPGRLARTPVKNPPPTGVEAYLTLHFADRLTKLLALRLAKETTFPHWKVVGVLFYLRAHPDAATTAVLVRFGIETENPEWRGYAVEALQAGADPELGAKVGAEMKRATSLKLPVPREIRELR